MRRFLWFVLFCGMAWAQVSITLPTVNGDVTATADAIAGNLNLKQGHLQGDVIIRDGTVTIGSPMVRFQFSGEKVDRVIAEQKIVVVAPTGIATAESGVYDVASKQVTLRGDVVLTRGKDVVRGQMLIYDLTAGTAVLQSTADQRVQALLAPNTSR